MRRPRFAGWGMPALLAVCLWAGLAVSLLAPSGWNRLGCGLVALPVLACARHAWRRTRR